MIGKWSGSANIDATNHYAFENVPPGKYVLEGEPNPSDGSLRTRPVTVDVKGGDKIEVTLSAK